jgi:hypothetical protein
MINMLNAPNAVGRLAKSKTTIFAVLIAGAIALPVLMSAPKARADGGDSGRGENAEALLGTWLLEVSIDPASVPPGSVLNFTVVPTFGAGGGYTQGETGVGPGGVGGAPEAHGNWVKTGYHRYASTSRAPNYDLTQHFTGERKVKNTFAVNNRGDELIGNFLLDLSLADGTILPFHPAGTYRGVRMPIEPLH